MTVSELLIEHSDRGFQPRAGELNGRLSFQLIGRFRFFHVRFENRDNFRIHAAPAASGSQFDALTQAIRQANIELIRPSADLSWLRQRHSTLLVNDYHSTVVDNYDCIKRRLVVFHYLDARMGAVLARGDFPSAKQEQFMLRFPDGMRDKIKRAAEKNGRSMNAEIIDRLLLSLFMKNSQQTDMGLEIKPDYSNPASLRQYQAYRQNLLLKEINAHLASIQRCTEALEEINKVDPESFYRMQIRD